MATDSQKNLGERIKDYMIVPAAKTVNEIQRLFPDSVLFGSIMLYLVTLNKAFGIFSIFIVESLLAHKLIANIAGKYVGPKPSGSSSGSLESCYPGFRAPRKEVDRMLRTNSYPSISIFTLFSIATYLLSSMYTFKETLDNMGQDWKGRIIFSTVFTCLIPVLVLFYRMSLGCETFTEILIAAFAGFCVGGIFYVINYKLFGVDGINFLGLPYMVNKNEQGSDIYVCAPTSVQYQGKE